MGPAPDTLNQHWAQGKATGKSFGFKMMMKMGWSDGLGLGKELQGNAKHVTVTKKTDNAGLGSVKDETGNAGWTAASASFDSVLSTLNARYGAQREESERKRDKKRKKKSKKKGQDGGAGTASMLLRHPKLLQSKNIRQYSATDMSAILGIKRPASPADGEEATPSIYSTLARAATTTTAPPADEEEEEEEEPRDKRKKKKKEKERRRNRCAKVEEKAVETKKAKKKRDQEKGENRKTQSER